MNSAITRDLLLRGIELERIGNAAVRAAQEESRRLGVPNVYEINGKIYYELPNGELSLTDPYVEPGTVPVPASPVPVSTAPAAQPIPTTNPPSARG